MNIDQWFATRPLVEELAAVLDEIDRDKLRDVMTNDEIAEWMAEEIIGRGIQIVS